MILSLSILAASLNLMGMIIYLKKQWTGAISSSAIGWGCSSLMVITSFVSLLGAGNWMVGLAYGVGAVPCLAIFVLALKNSRAPRVERSHVIAVALAVGALIIAQYQPLYSIFAISFYYLCTYTIFALSILKSSIEENWLPWSVWTLSALFNVLSGSLDGAGMALVLPITSLMGWGSITTLLIIKTQSGILRSESIT